MKENLSVVEALDLLKKNDLTSVELVKYCLDQIKSKNSKYNVFLFVRNEDEILSEAEKADDQRKNGSSKKLLGIPFALKDSYMAVGTPTTAGDKCLEGATSEYNSTITQRLLDEGAILIGKTNMDAWGFGSTNENSAYGPALNPFNPDHVAGGSSGGGAASVALDMALFAVVEDTGGSNRNPASFCGLYGLKPTNGRISRFGCLAYASSLDTVAPIARSAEDLKLILSILEGPDGRDMTVQDMSDVKISPAIRKFAYSKDYIPNGLSEETKEIYLNYVEKLKAIGYEAIEVSLPSPQLAVSVYFITAMSEASTNLARYHGTRYGLYEKSDDASAKSWEDIFKNSRTSGFQKEAKRRVLLGTYMLSEGYYDAYYKKAQQLRNMYLAKYTQVLELVDFLLSPVTLYSAPKLGEELTDPVKIYLEDMYTVTANLATLPAVAFPAGKTKADLPIGLQLIGKKFEDHKLLDILASII